MSEACIHCRKTKGVGVCEVCHQTSCKDCTQYLPEDTFSFQSKLSAELKHHRYCIGCYEQHVTPALEAYHEILERAREVYFFFTTHKRPPTVLKRAKEVLRVTECKDRDETILRLGFMAAALGFNAVVEAEVKSQKIRQGAYQKMGWSGVGIAAQVDATKLLSGN